MSRILRSLAIAALAMSVAATALAVPAQAGRPGRTASKATTPATHSVTGTLEKYDASGNSVVVNTGSGSQTLTLAAQSSIRMGATRLAPADLTAHTGQKVKVRYSDENGQRTVQTLQIEGSGAPTARAQTSAKTPAKK
jgi:hypothetical protein